MTHDEAVARDLPGEYAMGRLEPAARTEFEAHFFECDSCFAAVEAEERVRHAIRQLASDGAPELTDAEPAPRSWTSAIPWALAAAAVVMAFVDVAVRRQQTTRLETQLAAAEVRAGVLDRTLADVRRQAASSNASQAPEANVPLAILQTTRGVTTATLNVPGDASRFVVWLEDVPPTRSAALDLTLAPEGGAPAFRLHGLRPNAQGAVVASFPTAGIRSGRYVVTVSTADADVPVATCILAIAR